MIKTCTYNELDGFTGSISHNVSDLPKLVNELKLACLLYDCVVLHANNIMEHPLTLPACEILHPFVRSGQLWTTTDFQDKTPIAFIEKRAELFLGDLSKKQTPLRGLPKRRQQELSNIVDRWSAIAPNDFILRRDIGVQVKTALANFNNSAFSQLKHTRVKRAYRMLEFIDTMQANHRFDRESLFAWLGKLIGLTQPKYLYDIAMVIQKSFLVDGAKQHGSSGAKVWFGQFTKRLQKENLINTSDFDNFTYPVIETKLKMIGLDLKWLLSLPVESLFEITNSAEWKNIRNSILDDAFDVSKSQEIVSHFGKNMSSGQKLEMLLTDAAISPLILPSAWSLSSQTLLGKLCDSTDAHPQSKTEFILNMSTHTIYHSDLPEKIVDLKVMELHLISILANAGDIGLYEEHIKQLDMEIEALERLDRSESTMPVHSFVSQDIVENRTNKLATLKSRLNKKLKPINLMICVKNMDGHWYLGDIHGYPKVVRLEETIWDIHHEGMYPKSYTPKKLSKQQILVWQCLWEHAPAFVNWKK